MVHSTKPLSVDGHDDEADGGRIAAHTEPRELADDLLFGGAEKLWRGEVGPGQCPYFVRLN